MFRNYLAAALRNLVRNKLFAAINIIGLAVGFAAALFIALFIRTELSFDNWLPGYERVYLMEEISVGPDGGNALRFNIIPGQVGLWLKDYFPQAKTARVAGTMRGLRHGDIQAVEHVGWADPELADVLPLPVIAGDLKAALNAPDGIAMTRRMARKYFGRDDPIGEVIEVAGRYPMRVMAVLDDLPPNTNLNLEIFPSGRASFSRLTELDSRPANNMFTEALTFVRLDPSTTIEAFTQALPSFLNQYAKFPPGFKLEFEPVPLSAVHFSKFDSQGAAWMKSTSDLGTISVFAAIGLLIIAVASINSVNLLTAQATARAVAVGIRKVSGAERRQLIVQFMGGTAAYVGASILLAAAILAIVLPRLSALLDRGIALDVARDPLFLLGIVAVAAVTVILAGLYPALILSALRPAAVLKGNGLQNARGEAYRNILVTLQFAVLIGCAVTAGTIYRQMQFASKEALRVDSDQVLIIYARCDSPFRQEVAKLAGVRGVACSGGPPLNQGPNIRTRRPDGAEAIIRISPVQTGLMEFYGLKPVAGRFLSDAYGSDVLPNDTWAQKNWPVVINETAVSKLGFSSAAEALGSSVSVTTSSQAVPRTASLTIIGVAPDFSPSTVRLAIEPSFFYAGQFDVLGNPLATLNVRLSGDRLSETLAAIDALWKRVGEKRPLQQTFFDAAIQARYLDISRQGLIFSVFAGVAVFVASLGLFGLSAFAAKRRTKEIGVRKALGANRMDVLRLLLWQFTKPVLWANAIAWPVGYVVMHRWLEGFAYHTALEPWVFLAASMLALVIAVLTVSGHALLVARAQPVAALRYE